MSQWMEVAAVVGLFAVRLAIPVAITVGVCYLLRRLDAHWQAQADAAASGPETGTPAAAAPATPCWIIKKCPESRYVRCPAYQQPSLACWLVRLRRDGRMSSACPNCAIFQAYVAARSPTPA